MNNDKKAFRLFLIIVFAVSVVVETVWIIFGDADTGIIFSALLMYIPLIGAVIAGRKYFKKQGSLGIARFKPFYIFLALIPLIYLGFSYGLYWLMVKSSFNSSLSFNLELIVNLIISFLIIIVLAIGEEVGWRGFMYPIVQRIMGWKKAIIVTGIIWALWHLPLIISGIYLPGTSMIHGVSFFIIEIIALTVILSWIRIKSNSVWPAALFHGIHNFLDQAIFQELTNNEKSSYFVGETGIITIVITILIAILILAFGRKIFEKGIVK